MNRDAWVIAGAMLPFAAHTATGELVQDAPASDWAETLQRLGSVGFDAVDLTDSWLRAGDLSAPRLVELRAVLGDVGLRPIAISVIRRSVIDPDDADENLEYSHRSLEAAAFLGCSTVSVGLHRPLTESQRRVLWFWTVDGPVDELDVETWQLATSRLRALGAHAAALGLRLSLEMYEDTLLGTADSAIRLLHDVNLENVGLNPDLGNLIRLQRPIEMLDAMVSKCLEHANYWHVKNYLRMEDPGSGSVLTCPTSLELGVLNYRAAIQVAIQQGFDGALCIEQYGGDGLGVMETNLRYLKTIIPAHVS